MLERELKLHVPTAMQAALESALRERGATELALHACYFDTQERDLAKAGIALRLRLEGDHWVQTIKAPGPDELSRIELNHPRPGPDLDLSVYEGTPVESALQRLDKPLQLRYETEVTRLILPQDTGDTVLELAFDSGVVKAGTHTMTLCELELELIRGAASGLFETGRDYLNEYRLILDFRSKAERGDALAQLAAAATNDETDTGASDALACHPSLRKPRRAGTIILEPGTSLAQAYHLCVSDCLSQVVRNAAFLAAADNLRPDPDQRVQYVHQIRVGIRRLRSCWKFFGKWIGVGDADLDELRTHFSALGQARDNDVLRLAIAPRLAQAGMPAMDPSTENNALVGQDEEIAQVVASPDFQICLLTLLEHQIAAEGEDDADTESVESSPPLPRAAAKRLNKWLKRVCRDGEHFDRLPPDAQHSLRKKVKRLRYSLDFCSSVLVAKRAAKVRAALTKAQEKLGELNDLHSAQLHYQRFAASQPPALFALGWLEAMRGQKVAEAQAALQALAKAGPLKHR